MADTLTDSYERGAISSFGFEYERNFILYLCFRCAFDEQIDSFNIMSNVKNAGSFDDVVFSYEKKGHNWKTVMLQLKHTEANKLISPEQLTKSKEPLVSLVKLWKGYSKTKQFCIQSKHINSICRFGQCHLVLYTNCKNDKGMEYCPLTAVTPGLMDTSTSATTATPNVYKFKMNENSKIYLQLKDFELGKEFLSKLTMFTSQASVRDLIVLIQQIIKTQYPLLNAEDIVHSMCQRVTSWMENSKIITKHIFRKEFSQLLIKKLHESKITSIIASNDIFKEDKDAIVKLKALWDTKKEITVCHSKCFELLTIRLINILQSSSSVGDWFYVDTKTFESYINEVTLFLQASSDKKILIIECQTLDECQKILRSTLLRSSTIHYNVGAMIVTNSDFMQKQNQPPNFELSSSFSDLKETTQCKVKNQKLVFQGELVYIKELLPKVIKSIREQILLDLLQKKEIEIGQVSPETDPIFIDRHMLVTKYKLIDLKNVVTNDVLQAFVISNCDKFVYQELYAISVEKYVCRKYGTVEVKQFRNLFLVDKTISYEIFSALVKDQESMFSNFHLFQREDSGNLIFHHTHGEVINKTLLKIDQELKYEKVNDVTAVGERFLLINGQAGLGKTCILKHWHKEFKERFRSKLVLSMNLNDQSNSFYTQPIDNIKDVYQLFTILFVMKYSQFESHLIEEYLQADEKCMVLLDGLDEIKSEFQAKAEKLISLLLVETKIMKLCVTSRPVVDFTRKNINYTLEEFNQDDQRRFLLKYWGNQFRDNGDLVSEFTESTLLQFASKYDRGIKKRLASIPLMTKLIADISAENLKEYIKHSSVKIPRQFGLLTLFRKVTNFELKRVLDSKCNMGTARSDFKTEFEIQREYINKLCMKISLSVLTADAAFIQRASQVLIESEETIENLVDSNKNKLSFVCFDECGKPKFTHRMFAEYYFAMCLRKCCKGNEEFIKKNLFLNNFSTVRYFFDLMLCEKNSNYTKIITGQKYELENIRMSETDDTQGRNELHLLACYGEVDHNVKDAIKLQAAEICMATDDVLGWTPVEYAYVLGRWKVVNQLLEIQSNKNIQKKLLHQVKQGIFSYKMNIDGLVHTIKHDYIHLFTFFIAYNHIINVLEPKEIKMYFKENQQMIWQRESWFSINPPELLNIVSYCNSSEILKKVISLYSKDDLNIISAVLAGADKTLHLLMNNGADINYTPEESSIYHEYQISTLMIAIHKKNIYITKLLIDRGADVFAKSRIDINSGNQLVIDFVVQSKEYQTLEYIITKYKHNQNMIKCQFITEFIRSSSNIDCLNPSDILKFRNENGSMLHLGCIRNNMSVVIYLLSLGIDINLADDNGDTALHLTADADIIRYMVRYGANVNAKNLAYLTPLHNAVIRKDINCVTALVESGAEIQAITLNGQTSLHMKTSIDIFKYLMKKKANVNAKDKEGNTPLHAAIVNNDLEIVKLFLKYKANVNDANVYGNTALHLVEEVDILNFIIDKQTVNTQNLRKETPLHRAVIKNHVEIVKILLANGASTNITDIAGATALFYAQSEDIVTLLLENGAEVNIKSVNNSTPLHNAVKKNKMEIVRMLINKNADLTAVDGEELTAFQLAPSIDISAYVIEMSSSLATDGTSPLHYVVKNDLKREILHFLDTESDVDAVDNTGKTPLHYAKSKEAAKYLLDHKARVDALDNMKSTPLMEAVKESYASVVEILIEHGANVNVSDINGMKPLTCATTESIVLLLIQNSNIRTNMALKNSNILHRAVSSNWKLVIEILLDNNFDVNSMDLLGRTPLFYANTLDILELLILKRARIDICDSEQFTPLHMALFTAKTALVERLIEYGANVNASTKEGKTAIFYAYSKETLKLLIKKGANVNARDIRNGTALHYAVERKLFDVVNELIKNKANIDARGEYGRTPIFYAKNENMISLLAGRNTCVLNCLDDHGATPLHEAVRLNDQETCKILLKLGTSANAVNKNGETALFFASTTKIIEILLAYNIDVNTKDIHRQTALHIAVKKDLIEVIEILLKYTQIDSVDAKMRTPLFYARSKQAAELLIENKENVNQVDINGCVPLHLAVGNNQRSVVDVLLLHGNVNVIDNLERTTLFYARSKEVAQVLIQHGTNVNHKQVEYKQTALHWAAKEDLTEVAEILLKYMNVDEVDNRGQTPLFYARSKQTAQLLIDHKTNVNHEDARNLTPFIDAVLLGKADIVDILAPLTNLNAIYDDGRTLLFYAENEEVVRSLIKHGANVKHKDENNLTALHYALAKDMIEVIQILAKHDDVNATDEMGRTPMYFAQSKEAVEILIKNKANINHEDKNKQTPLKFAIIEEKRCLVQSLIPQVDVNNIDDWGKTILFCAKSKKMTALLIQNGVDCNHRDVYNKTALHHATVNDLIGVITILLEQTKVDAVDINKQTPLFFAKSKEAADLLIRKGANINHRDLLDTTPLYSAIARGVTDVIEYLIPLLNCKEVHGLFQQTMLFYVRNRYVTNLLIQNGADVNQKDICRRTALHSAVNRNAIEVIQILLKHDDVNVNEADKLGQTPLYFAKTQHAARLLLKYKACPNHRDLFGRTPLNSAVERDLLEVVEVLLPYSDLKNINGKGETIMSLAKSDVVRQLLVEYERDSDSYSDNLSDNLSVNHSDNYSDSYNDNYSDNYNDNYSDNYSDNLSDNLSVNHSDNYSDSYNDNYSDNYNDN